MNFALAACRDADPAIFFPAPGESLRAAKRVCARCPIRRACLEWALEHRERHGVWGGASERERERMRKQRRTA